MLSNVIFCVLFANLVASAQDIPVYPAGTCPELKAIHDVKYEQFPGFWYEVVTSTNLAFNCAIFQTTQLSDVQFRVASKGKMLNGTEFELDIYYQMGRPGNDDSAPLVLDVYKGYFYHMDLVPLFFDGNMLVSYACSVGESGKLEEIHVYSRKTDYDKEAVQKTLAANSLDKMPTVESFSNCPKQFYKF